MSPLGLLIVNPVLEQSGNVFDDLLPVVLDFHLVVVALVGLLDMVDVQGVFLLVSLRQSVHIVMRNHLVVTVQSLPQFLLAPLQLFLIVQVHDD